MNIYIKLYKTGLRQIILALFLSAAIVAPAAAQNSTSSPLSIFGIGEIEYRDFGITSGFGGVGIGLKSRNYLNTRNPAGLSGIDTLKFIFDLSGAARYSKFSTSSTDMEALNFNFKNLAVGCRIAKWWTSSVGLSPYTNVGYNISKDQAIEGSLSDYYTTAFTGDGGINRFYWGNSFEPLKGLSLGVTAAYYFGSITNSEMAQSISTIETMTSNKIKFDFGAQYTQWLGKFTRITVGGIYGYQTSSRMYCHQTVVNPNTGQVYIDKKAPSKTWQLPESYGGGLSLFTNKGNAEWTIAADYSQQNWSVNSNKLRSISFADSRLYSFGVQMTPNTRRPRGYLDIIRWQIGGNYNESYIAIHGYQMKDYSITIGAGLPFFVPYNPAPSYVNVAIILGSAGTGARGGISENYALLSVNLSLIENWFSKQKYK